VADIGLAEAVESLRAELLAAVEEGRGSPLQFELDPVTLTVQAVVTKEGGGRVGWKILEASGKVATEATQSVTLVLKPLTVAKDGTATPGFKIAGAATQQPRV
jgi:hypothetical protein